MINERKSFPFGETSLGSYAKKRYRYCGKERDEESGLYYYGARYYAPWLCRFISCDPLAADYPYLTPYNYAGNKPITHKDIDGLQSTGDAKVENGGGGNPPPDGATGGNNVVPESKVLGVDPTITTYKEAQAMAAEARAKEANNITIKDGVLKGDNVTTDITKVTEREEMKKVEGIVLHRTGGSNAQGSIDHTKSIKGETGFHIIIDKDGSVTQINNTNRRANHVGKPTQDITNYNSIGIEVVGSALDKHGNKTLKSPEVIGWEALTPEQVKSVADVLEILMLEYGLSMSAVFPHEKVSEKTPGEGGTVLNTIKDIMNKRMQPVIDQKEKNASFLIHKQTLNRTKSIY